MAAAIAAAPESGFVYGDTVYTVDGEVPKEPATPSTPGASRGAKRPTSRPGSRMEGELLDKVPPHLQEFAKALTASLNKYSCDHFVAPRQPTPPPVEAPPSTKGKKAPSPKPGPKPTPIPEEDMHPKEYSVFPPAQLESDPIPRPNSVQRRYLSPDDLSVLRSRLLPVNGGPTSLLGSVNWAKAHAPRNKDPKKPDAKKGKDEVADIETFQSWCQATLSLPLETLSVPGTTTLAGPVRLMQTG
ncbi:hypothetical protein KIPB_012550, partial [Kipferlia bialata]|eukprot:g12550.t1